MTRILDSRVEAVEVSAGYAGVDAIRRVSLVAPAGKVTALVGANGAGKTTLLNALAGLHPPSGGTVLIDGDDVTAEQPSRRAQRGVCYIPEGRAVFPSLSVRDNLRLYGNGEVSDPVEVGVDAFPQLGMRLNQLAGSLSGGQQQMLALARAWITRPEYILLDEVSMGLAPRLVTEIFDFLSRLSGSGAGLLVVEQYVKKVLEIADLVYVLQKGRIAYVGPPAELDADAIAATYLGSGQDKETAR